MNFSKVSIILMVVAFCNVIPGMAQNFTQVSDVHRDAYLKKIQNTSGNIQTLECDFQQSQKIMALSSIVKSEGKMYYKKQDCLRWEYLKPDNYCFIVNHGKVVMKRDGKTSQNSEVKLFGKISKIILSGISGNNIVDTKNFTATYGISGELFRITLIPRNSGMRKVMNAIIMDFNMERNFIHAIEMVQSRGITRIEFKDKKINTPLTENKFN